MPYGLNFFQILFRAYFSSEIRSFGSNKTDGFFPLSFLGLPTLSRHTYLNGNVYRTTSDQIFYTPPNVFSIYRIIDDRINIYLKIVNENLFVFVDRLADVVTKKRRISLVSAGSTLVGILKNYQGRSKGENVYSSKGSLSVGKSQI